MIEKIKNFNWWRILMPFTTYHKLKKGWIHPMLILLDMFILMIPFSTIFVVLLVKYWNDHEK
jgi:hypothetical protein